MPTTPADLERLKRQASCARSSPCTTAMTPLDYDLAALALARRGHADRWVPSRRLPSSTDAARDRRRLYFWSAEIERSNRGPITRKSR